jgi:hypothetical protein
VTFKVYISEPLLHPLQMDFFWKWWQKTNPLNLYAHAGDAVQPPSADKASVQQTAQSVPKFEPIQITPDIDMTTDMLDGVGVGSAEAQAVATGVDHKPSTGRKGRVRKSSATPRVSVPKKKKAPKAPRNPFRRSETGKLQLKSLQMSKRIETMTPRVAVLRDRLEVMESRLIFVSGKFELVKSELASREGGATADPAVSSETVEEEVDDSEMLANELEQLAE